MITEGKVRYFLIWCYWMSPLSWGLRSLAINEYSSSRYDYLVDGVRAGDSYMDAFEIRTDRVYQYTAIIVLLAYYFLFITASSIAVQVRRITFVIGTRLNLDDSDDADLAGTIKDDSSVKIDVKPAGAEEMKEHGSGVDKSRSKRAGDMPLQVLSVPIAPGSPKSVSHSVETSKNHAAPAHFALPFTPVVLSWLNLSYTIYEGKNKTPKKLLDGIRLVSPLHCIALVPITCAHTGCVFGSGFARPGELVSLMGSSGAGKTTLLDVIAGRKTVGTIEGKVLLNGLESEPITFQYVAVCLLAFRTRWLMSCVSCLAAWWAMSSRVTSIWAPQLCTKR